MNKKLLLERKERFIQNLIKEAILNVLAEQEEMDLAAPQPEPTPEVPPAPPPAPEESQEETPENAQEFTVDSMVSKLNIIRGGKSLKDPEVYGKLNTFFNNLTEEQKSSMKWMLDELSNIITNVEAVDQMQQVTPEAPPSAPQPAAPAAPPAEPAAPITPNI